jgi:flagellum-specific peptidoglycan hydrolase FlgJ
VTDRAIYGIELDTSAFDKFQQTYAKFQKEVEGTQSKWKANSKLIDAAAANFKRMAAADPVPGDQNVSAFMEAVRRLSDTGLAPIGAGAKLITANLRQATTMMAKWSGITTVFGSLIAAGGIYGLSRMASGVGRQRTSASQLGTTWGRQAAAAGAFVGIHGAGRIISGLSEATASRQGMAPLHALMGNEANRLAGGDPIEAFVAMLPHLKKMADTGGSWRAMNERIHAMGLDKLGVSVETLRLLKAMSPAEIKEMIATYRGAKSRMELSETDQRAMQEFATAIEEAEQALTNRFAANLSKLTPVVEKGVTLLTTAVEALDKSGLAGDLLAKFDKGVIQFADLFDEPEFGKLVSDYASDVRDIAFGISRLTSKEFWRYWNPFSGGSSASGGSTGAASTGPWQNKGPSGSGISGTQGGTTPSVPQAVGGARNATGAGKQPGAVTPSDHRPHLGPVPMPWTTRSTGGTTPRPKVGPTTSEAASGGGSPMSGSAVDRMMSLEGLHRYPPAERAKIRKFLQDGGADLDPATSAWCAATVSSALTQAGYNVPRQGNHGTWWVPDYNRWGQHVSGSVRADDVVIMNNDHHIGLATGRERQGKIETMEGNAGGGGAGGNWAHRQWRDRSFINDIRRATDAERPHGAPAASGQSLSDKKTGEQSSPASDKPGVSPAEAPTQRDPRSMHLQMAINLESKFGAQKAFAASIYSKARAMGIPHTQAQLVALQASLESAYGTSPLAKKANNYFGMTGPGDRGTMTVHAYGHTYQQSVYSSPEVGIKHWWETQKRVWPGAASAKSLDEALAAQHHGERGGYSETKDYPKRIRDVVSVVKGFDQDSGFKTVSYRAGLINRTHHPHTTGQQSHVDVIDHTGEAHIGVISRPRGPMYLPGAHG